ncbi:hypothetical protein SpCBS45565_g05791 [Spizellomyces sp. 'palustris']|nr:hypothetical protein SpCBS45565_g05791 [Spizellomyces sp. 'palustris']
MFIDAAAHVHFDVPQIVPPEPVSNSTPHTHITQLDKASLQQHIQQRLRMLTSENDNDDDDGEPFLAVMATAKSTSHSPHLRAAALPSSPRSNPAHSFTPPPSATSESCSSSNTSQLAPETCTWQEVDDLQSHYMDWPAEDARDWKKTKSFIIRLLEDCGLLEDDDRVPRGPRGDASDFVLNLISKIESNGFGLWSPKKEQCMGRAVFPKASYFNHSCDPNCVMIQNGMVMSVTARRTVNEREALTISYIDTNMPLQARRARLQADYFFVCQCTRCVAEEKGGSGDGRRKVTYERSYMRDRGDKNGKGRNEGQGQVQASGQHQTGACGSFASGMNTDTVSPLHSSQPSSTSTLMPTKALLSPESVAPPPPVVEPLVSNVVPLAAKVIPPSPTSSPSNNGMPRLRTVSNVADLRQRTATGKKMGRGGGNNAKRRNTTGNAARAQMNGAANGPAKVRGWSVTDGSGGRPP